MNINIIIQQSENAVYAEVLATGDEAVHKISTDPEMIQNVAYGPLKLRS